MNRVSACVLSLLIILAAACLAWAAAPEGEILIDISNGKAVAFSHATHDSCAANCQTCHHKDAAGAEQKCTTCHTKEGKDDAIKGKDAFHKQCKGCHKEKAKGPTTCKACHSPAK